MRATIAVMTAVALLMMFGGTASAVVYGQPDGQDHPNVGALLAPQTYSDGTWASCSGTLISPTVFLTAAHCAWGLDRMAVTFDTNYVASTGTTYWGPDMQTRATAAGRATRTTLPSSSSPTRSESRPPRSPPRTRFRISLGTSHSRPSATARSR